MKIYLIIQRTFNGLKTDFKSEDLTLSDTEIENIFGDEQSASQLASASIIYTIENLEKFRVYSFINNTVSDNAGRAGYYAIRLLVPTDKILVNVRGIFNEIAKRYEQYFEQKRLVDQDYSKLLAAVFEKNCVLDKAILVGSKKGGIFYAKYAADERVDDTMNEDSTYLIKKLYLFAKDQSKSDETIRQSGFKSFASLSDSIKNVKVINADNYLQVLKINDNKISFPQGNFEIFVFDSDLITYRDKNRDSKKDKEHRGKTLEVRRPVPVYVPPIYSDNKNNENNGFKLGHLLITGFATLLIGGLAGWLIKNQLAKKEISKIIREQPIPVENTPYYFSVDPSIKDVILRGENISEIASYKFKYNSKDQKWSYDEGFGRYQDLDKDKLDKIAKDKYLNGDDLRNALEKISGKNLTSNITTGLPEKDQSEKDSGSGQSTKPEQQEGSNKNPPSGTGTGTQQHATSQTQTEKDAAKEKIIKDKLAKEKAIKEAESKKQNAAKQTKIIMVAPKKVEEPKKKVESKPAGSQKKDDSKEGVNSKV